MVSITPHLPACAVLPYRISLIRGSGIASLSFPPRPPTTTSVNPGGGREAFESFDGNFAYYTKGFKSDGVVLPASHLLIFQVYASVSPNYHQLGSSSPGSSPEVWEWMSSGLSSLTRRSRQCVARCVFASQ